MAPVVVVFGFDELVSVIVDHIEDADIQTSVPSLMRVFPRSYFPLSRFFESITLRRPEQLVHLHRRLRGPHSDARFVRELRLQSWKADAEVVSNLLDVLDDLKFLAFSVGPNFAPDVLQRIMERQRDGLETLMIRFRP